MAKAIMVSIRPVWVEKIISGEKTVEVRKSRPKLAAPFKCYIYCTKDERPEYHCMGNGRVVGEFVCSRIENLIKIGYTNVREPHRYKISSPSFEVLDPAQLFESACLSETDVEEYLKGRVGYGWHISNLEIYDKPMELKEFWRPPELYCEKERCGGCPYDQVADVFGEYSYDCEWKRPLTRPPQSWCYVEARPWVSGERIKEVLEVRKGR